MKKVILGFICLLLITTCGLEMPKSITITGNPALYVPLGSPFAGMKEEDRLENLISPDNIKKMLNDNVEEAGADDELKIYEVDEELTKALGIDPDVQTYLARYPLADMPLDFEEYAKKSMDAVNAKKQFTIPDVIVPSGTTIYLTEAGPINEGAPGYDKPFIKIPLKDMARLVMWVKRTDDGIFGLEIAYDQKLADYLEISIPGFGIPWMKGIKVDNKLRYYKEDKTMFYPQKRDENNSPITSDLVDESLLIYAKITDSFTKQTLEPGMVFDWENAMIDTTGTDSQGSFKMEYPINNDLSEFLGNKVSFERVQGFMYMSGVTVEDSTLSIGIYDSDIPLYPTTPSLLHSVDPPPEFPVGDKFTISDKNIFLKQSLTDPLDLTHILSVSNATLKVGIQITEMRITKTELEANKTTIHFDLLILIPLDLKVSAAAGKEAPDVTVDGVNIRQTYVPLDLGDLLKGMGGEDLLGRKGEDDYLKLIEYVDISIKYSASDINIIDPTKLAVLVRAGDKNKLLEFKKNSASIRLDGDILKYPFSPEFTVLLKKDDNEDFGSFRILRPKDPSFNFRLYVEAKAALEYTLDL